MARRGTTTQPYGTRGVGAGTPGLNQARLVDLRRVAQPRGARITVNDRGWITTPADAYGQTVLGTAGLFSWWRLGEASDTDPAQDYVGASPGVYVNSPAVGVTGPAGTTPDTAVTFAAASLEHVTIDNDVPLRPQAADFSLEFWILKSASPAAAEWILDYGDGNANGWGVRINTSGQVQGNVATTTWNSTVNVCDNVWHHVVVSCPRTGSFTTYIDGTASGTVAANATTINGSGAASVLLARRNAGNYLNGSLDEIALYLGVALDQATADAHYQAGVAGGGPQTFPQSLVATATTSSTFGRQTNKLTVVTAIGTATLVRQANKNAAATTTETATIIRRAGKQVAVTSTTAPTVVKSPAKALSAASTATPALSASKVLLRTLAASTSLVATLIRQAAKNATATTIAAPAITKQPAKNLTATSTATSALTTLKVVLRSIVATIIETAAITRRASKNVQTTTTAQPAIAKQPAGTLRATASLVAAVVKQPAKRLAATSTTTSALTPTKVILRAIAATMTLTATMTRQARIVRQVVAVLEPAFIKDVRARLAATAAVQPLVVAGRVMKQALTATVSLVGSVASFIAQNFFGSIEGRGSTESLRGGFGEAAGPEGEGSASQVEGSSGSNVIEGS